MTGTINERLEALRQENLPEEYFAAIRIRDEAELRLGDLPAPAAVNPDLEPFTLGHIADEWIDECVNRKARQEEWEQRRAILLTVRRDADGTANSIVGNLTDQFLTAYHGELQRLLGEVRQLAEQLDGAATPEQAIAADRAPQWKRLGELTDDYADLRSAQQVLIPNDLLRAARPTNGRGEDHESDLYLRNLDQLWPSWRTPGEEQRRFINVDGSQRRFEPWPSDPTQLLLWLVTSPAEPWIPTRAQVNTLWDDRRARLNPMPKVNRKRPDRGIRQTFGSISPLAG